MASKRMLVALLVNNLMRRIQHGTVSIMLLRPIQVLLHLVDLAQGVVRHSQQDQRGQLYHQRMGVFLPQLELHLQVPRAVLLSQIPCSPTNQALLARQPGVLMLRDSQVPSFHFLVISEIRKGIKLKHHKLCIMGHMRHSKPPQRLRRDKSG